MNIREEIEKWKLENTVEDFPNIEVPEHLQKSRIFGKSRNEYIYNLMKYNSSFTLREIGEVFGIKRERVRQILEEYDFRKSDDINKELQERAERVSDEDIFKLANDNPEMSWKDIANHFSVSENYARSRQYDEKYIISSKVVGGRVVNEYKVNLPNRIYHHEDSEDKYNYINKIVQKNKDKTYEEIVEILQKEEDSLFASKLKNEEISKDEYDARTIYTVSVIQNALRYSNYRRRAKRVVVSDTQRLTLLILLLTTNLTYDEISDIVGVTRIVIATTKSNNFDAGINRKDLNLNNKYRKSLVYKISDHLNSQKFVNGFYNDNDSIFHCKDFNEFKLLYFRDKDELQNVDNLPETIFKIYNYLIKYVEDNISIDQFTEIISDKKVTFF